MKSSTNLYNHPAPASSTTAAGHIQGSETNINKQTRFVSLMKLSLNYINIFSS